MDLWPFEVGIVPDAWWEKSSRQVVLYVSAEMTLFMPPTIVHTMVTGKSLHGRALEIFVLRLQWY